MGMIAPLPASVRKYLEKNTHLGLALDKYVESWSEEFLKEKGRATSKSQATPDKQKGSEEERSQLSKSVQRPTIEKVVALSQREPPGLNYEKLRARWEELIQALKAVTFKAKTAGPFTLHLSRASALENAGICLHPIYGFVYLPGSGLKGMARAFAETVWLPAQSDQKEAWKKIEDVFGWAPNPDRRQQIEDANHPAEPRRDPFDPEKIITASSGQIIFLDAWPENWLRLMIDILNNHHPSYYLNQEPPGDWDSPVPVYFLAVPGEESFTFALAKRRWDVPDELLNLATEWLMGALKYEGAGAKTASGYGSFELTAPPQAISHEDIEKAWQGAVRVKRRAEFQCTLELVTPAFLAGALQQEEDCDLRPSTLRGLLRWWWRTMHAGYVDVPTLYRLEAAVWGDTESGAPVRITVNREGRPEIEQFAYKKEGKSDKGKPKLEPNREALSALGIILSKSYTTQGLFYAAYGMDEISHGERRTRYWVSPGARWRVQMVARRGRFVSSQDNSQQTIELSPDVLLRQAQAALWLLSHYGGVGSRCRKGFGSFRDVHIPGISSLDDIKRLADEFRGICKVQSATHPEVRSPSLATHILKEEISLPWTNPYRALDEVGQAYEAAAQAPQATGHGKHCREKLGLGLPRQIHGPLPYRLPHQKTYQAPEQLQVRGPDKQYVDRHASPIFLHFAQRDHGPLTLRVIAFPSRFLEGLETNRRFLEKFLSYFEERLRERTTNPAREKPPRLSRPRTPVTQHAPSTPLPKANDQVQAVLLEEKTKKGGWRARLSQGDPTPGAIVNSADVPPDAMPNQQVTLIVNSISIGPDGSIRQIQFRWPTDQG